MLDALEDETCGASTAEAEEPELFGDGDEGSTETARQLWSRKHLLYLVL